MDPIFLYGDTLDGRPNHGWVHDLLHLPAHTFGHFYFDPRHRPLLLPNTDGLLLHGILVYAPRERTRILSFLLGQGTARIPLTVFVFSAPHTRPVEATTWGLTPTLLHFGRYVKTPLTDVRDSSPGRS